MTTLTWTVATRWDNSACERATYNGRTAEVWKSKGRFQSYALSIPGDTVTYHANPHAAREAAAEKLGCNLPHETPRSNIVGKPKAKVKK